jgi:hypothetical protein
MLFAGIPKEIPVEQWSAISQDASLRLVAQDGCTAMYSTPDLLGLVPEQLQRLMVLSFVDAHYMRLMRQLLLFCYKALVPHDSTTVTYVKQQYSRLLGEVGQADYRQDSLALVLYPEVVRRVRLVLGRMRMGDFSPSHGPGKSTTPKWQWSKSYRTIDQVFPYYPFYCVGDIDAMAEMPEYTDDPIQCKLTAVPKDSRGPRLISVHPAEAIWAQQGARRMLEGAISRRLPSSQTDDGPKGHIQFNDQTVNAALALSSSRHGKYATLDLKDASDRLSERLVADLFGKYYPWFACSRAQYVNTGTRQTPKLEIVTSYAPMGNATTFPVQSLVYWAICVAALHADGDKHPNRAFVFGDDIIVPTGKADQCIAALHAFGLVVNTAKCFWRGRFRESCGTDAYCGTVVTPLRWKTVVRPNSLPELAALSQIAMALRRGGYESAASTCYRLLRKKTSRKYGALAKTNNPEHGGLIEFTEDIVEVLQSSFWEADTQQLVNRVICLESEGLEPFGSGWNRLLNAVLSIERDGGCRAPVASAPTRFRPVVGWVRFG